MIDISLVCNGVDFSSWLSTYEVHKAYEAVSSITTLDGVEHVADRTRDLVIFSLVPFNDTIATSAYNALKTLQFSVTYTDPNIGTTAVKTMRVTTDLEAVFGIKSIDGNRYYKGGKITLRAKNPNA